MLRSHTHVYARARVCRNAFILHYIQIVSATNIQEALFPFIIVCVAYVYLLIANHIGQEIIDHSNHIFQRA